MKLRAFDKGRGQYIPQSDFAVTGDGHVLIAQESTPSLLLYPPGCPSEIAFAANDDVPDDSVEVSVDED